MGNVLDLIQKFRHEHTCEDNRKVLLFIEQITHKKASLEMDISAEEAIKLVVLIGDPINSPVPPKWCIVAILSHGPVNVSWMNKMWGWTHTSESYCKCVEEAVKKLL